MAGTPGTLAPTVMSVLHGTLKVAGLSAASWRNPEAQPTFFFFFLVLFFFFASCFYFLASLRSKWVLVSQPGIEPVPPTVEVKVV